MYLIITKRFFLNLLCYLSVCFLSLSCGIKNDKDQVNTPNQIINTIEEVVRQKKLKIAINYSPTGFFVYRGTPMGFHHDLAERLAKHIGVSLELVITKNEQEQLKLLKERKVDLIVESIANSPSSENFIDFIVPFETTNLVLVQRKSYNWPHQKPTIQKVEHLLNKNVHLAPIQAHRNCMQQIAKQLDHQVFVKDVDEQITQYQLVEEVAQNGIDYAIVDENIGRLMQSRYQNIDLSLKLSQQNKFGWVTHIDADGLTKYIDNWVVEQKNTRSLATLYKKYYKNHYAFVKRSESEYLSHETGKISKFDNLIKKHAQKNNFDWRLIAALIQQESRFNPTAVSWAGAKGLMQLMPKTAKQYGFKNLTDPELNIKAGIKHLIWLSNFWEEKIRARSRKRCS